MNYFTVMNYLKEKYAEIDIDKVSLEDLSYVLDTEDFILWLSVVKYPNGKPLQLIQGISNTKI